MRRAERLATVARLVTTSATGRPTARVVEVLVEIVLGEEFGPLPVVIDDHAAKAYAFAHDDYGWLQWDQGGARRQSPPLILGNRLLRIYEQKFERHANSGALHTRQELWYHRPAFVGDTVTIRGRYVDAYVRRQRQYLVLESTAWGADGGLLVTSRSTEAMPQSVEVLGDAVPSDGGGSLSLSAEARRAVDAGDDLGPATTVAHPGMPTGTRISPIHKTVEQDQISVFSGIGQYERNFHTDLEMARAAGLERPIAQAMQSAGHICELLARFFGPTWTTTGWQDSKFLNPVPAGERLTIGGRVTSVEHEEAGGRIGVELWVRDSSGATTAVGWASALVSG